MRTFISFPAGVARMDLRKFIIYSTAGAFIWSTMLVQAGVLLGDNWTQIRTTLQPFDLLIAVIVFAADRSVHLVAHRLPGPGPARVAAGSVTAARQREIEDADA